jgi:hypothetical protein
LEESLAELRRQFYYTNQSACGKIEAILKEPTKKKIIKKASTSSDTSSSSEEDIPVLGKEASSDDVTPNRVDTSGATVPSSNNEILDRPPTTSSIPTVDSTSEIPKN